jgi:hypothetical protein
MPIIPRAPLVAAILLSFCCGCEEQPSPTAEPSAPPEPADTAPAPAPPTAPASAAEEEPAHDCPEGTSGKGTLKEPCEAKGSARMMQVQWTGKIGDTGPSFRVTNNAKEVVLYGKIAVYFYDKAGKQLEVTDTVTKKTRPFQHCFGNIFAGVMKPAEKAVLTFSCVKKEHVPEGTAAIEGEMQVVGFADESGEKSEYYWKNDELVPNERPRGGVKKS